MSILMDGAMIEITVEQLVGSVLFAIGVFGWIAVRVYLFGFDRGIQKATDIFRDSE